MKAGEIFVLARTRTNTREEKGVAEAIVNLWYQRAWAHDNERLSSRKLLSLAKAIYASQ